MSDAAAVVWTRATGEARKLGLLVKAGGLIRFTYDRDAKDLPGISVVHDTKLLAGGPAIEFKHSQQNPLPPMFQALVPPRDRNNLQRRILLSTLQKEFQLAGLPEEDLEWLMLIKSGRDAIGHLDVFAGDEEARRWYESPTPPITLDEIDDRPLWKLIVEASSPMASPVTIDRIIDALQIHPSAGGAMPKILARVRQGERVVDELVKLSTEEFPHILSLEDIAYSFHERVGTAQPKRKLITTRDGIEVLSVERFDRLDGVPVPLESIFCALYTSTNGSPNRVEEQWSNEGTQPNLEMVAALLRSSLSGATIRPKEDCEEFFKRQVMALLTGNGDNHLQNSAILGRRGAARLSPLFDPAPMRGYHGKTMVSSVSFSGIAFRGANVDSEIGAATLRLGTAFGLSRPKTTSVVRKCLDATEDFAHVVRRTVPAKVADSLLTRIEAIRYRIEIEMNSRTAG